METYNFEDIQKLIDVLPHRNSPYILIVKLHLNAELGSLKQFRSVYNETEQALGEENTMKICQLLSDNKAKHDKNLTKQNPLAESLFFPAEEIAND